MKLGVPEKGPSWKERRQSAMNAIAAVTKLQSAGATTSKVLAPAKGDLRRR